MKSEVWKQIKGYVGLYEVSNLGRVRGVERTRKGAWGNVCRVNQKILTAKRHEKGYSTIQLWRENKRRTFKIHRLVARAFIENPKHLPEVDHKNRKRNDNRVANLVWSTVVGNRQKV